MFDPWQVWQSLFGPPRVHKTLRLDKGIARVPTGGSSTERGWIRERRLQVEAALSQKTVTGKLSYQSLQTDDLSTWDESHEKEATFQRQSRLKRKVEALQNGLLLPEEADEELEQFISQMKQPMQSRDSLTREEQKKNALHQGPQLPEFLTAQDSSHLTAFVCPGTRNGVSVCRRLGMTMTRDVGLANVIACVNLRSVPETVLITAALRGTYVLDTKILEHGSGGLCLKFVGATQLQRFVWASLDFKQD